LTEFIEVDGQRVNRKTGEIGGPKGPEVCQLTTNPRHNTTNNININIDTPLIPTASPLIQTFTTSTPITNYIK
jgi:hypothetical protein